MKVSLFYLPSVGNKARGRTGHGRAQGRPLRPDAPSEISAQARLADDLGYDSISFTEHHFHVEGFELSNNPVLLDLYIGMQTKRLRVGQLGIVLPTHNPIRVAEDIAMLDHMTGGRANAGFARGYQRRWVDIMAQQTHGIHGALPHQHDEIDAANRAAFEENFRIIKQAWTQDLLTYQGKYWRIPPGETPWTLEATGNGGAASRTVLSRRWRWCRSPCRSRIRPSSSPSRPRTQHPMVRAGRRHRGDSRRSSRLRAPVCDSMPRSRASRQAKGWACCATSSSPIPTRRPTRSGMTAATFAANNGSCRSDFLSE